MANNSDYYRAQLEAQARGREHAQHIEEYARMCKMMIEESVPILIEQYMAQKKHSVALDVKTYLNGKFVDYKTELTNAFARVFQKFM
jgi:hypothetical protein